MLRCSFTQPCHVALNFTTLVYSLLLSRDPLIPSSQCALTLFNRVSLNPILKVSWPCCLLEVPWHRQARGAPTVLTRGPLTSSSQGVPILLNKGILTLAFKVLQLCYLLEVLWPHKSQGALTLLTRGTLTPTKKNALTLLLTGGFLTSGIQVAVALLINGSLTSYLKVLWACSLEVLWTHVKVLWPSLWRCSDLAPLFACSEPKKRKQDLLAQTQNTTQQKPCVSVKYSQTATPSLNTEIIHLLKPSWCHQTQPCRANNWHLGLNFGRNTTDITIDNSSYPHRTALPIPVTFLDTIRYEDH
jgi:hypothetical protein